MFFERLLRRLILPLRARRFRKSNEYKSIKDELDKLILSNPSYQIFDYYMDEECYEAHDVMCDSMPSSMLSDLLSDMDKPFGETLLAYIDKKGITDVEAYKRSNVSRKVFSKIKCNKYYQPSKVTAVSFAIGLRLDIDETEHLLRTAGLCLSDSNTFDIIIEYFIVTGNYKSIHDVNDVLYQYDQVLLGC